MDETLACLIRENLGWNPEDTEVVYQGDGLTNRNYIVSNGTEKYAVRLASPNAASLGIDRHAELAAMREVDAIGVGAQVIFFSTESGNMITRFIEGEKWVDKDVAVPDNMRKIAEAFRKIHALPQIEKRFDPYRDIESRVLSARERNLPLPEDLGELVARMERIRADRSRNAESHTGLCHNDPFPNNFLHDGTVRVLDWEYAGTGDVFFDLACLCYYFSDEESELFLEMYFQGSSSEHAASLREMKYIVRFWNAMWAVLQIGSGDSGFDYANLAGLIFEGMRSS